MLTNLFQSALGRSTLIAPEDTWSLLALLLASVALAIYLEQRYTWVRTLSNTANTTSTQVASRTQNQYPSLTRANRPAP